MMCRMIVIAAGLVVAHGLHVTSVLTRPRRAFGRTVRSLSAPLQLHIDDIPSSVGWQQPRRRIGDLVRLLRSDERGAGGGHKASTGWSHLRDAAVNEAPILGASTLALVGAALCDVAAPHYSSGALNGLVAGAPRAATTAQIRRLVAVNVAGAAFTGLRGCLFWWAGARVVQRLRVRVFTALLEKEMAFYDTRETGELSSRLFQDAAKVSNVVRAARLPGLAHLTSAT